MIPENKKNESNIPSPRKNIEINEALYDKLEKLSKFIGQEASSLAENFIENEIGILEREPYQILEYYMTDEQFLKKVFGPGYKI